MTKKKADKKGEEILKELNENQKAFCREYMMDWNATQAYMRVYGGEEKVCAAASSRLLSNVNIKEYILLNKNKLEEMAGISRMKVLAEFMKLAFSNMSSFHNSWMSRKEFDQLTDAELACISEIKNETIKGDNWDKEIVKIKLHDKQKALENINKMMGYNVPEEQNINITAQITGMKIK